MKPDAKKLAINSEIQAVLIMLRTEIAIVKKDTLAYVQMECAYVQTVQPVMQ